MFRHLWVILILSFVPYLLNMIFKTLILIPYPIYECYFNVTTQFCTNFSRQGFQIELILVVINS